MQRVQVQIQLQVQIDWGIMLDNERSHGSRSDRNRCNPIFRATDSPLTTRSLLSLSLSLSLPPALHRELAQLSASGESREEFHFRLPISIQCGRRGERKIVFSVCRKRLSARVITDDSARSLPGRNEALRITRLSRKKNVLGATIMTYKETRVFRANVANFNACEKRSESCSLFFFSDGDPIPDPCVRTCGFIEREKKGSDVHNETITSRKMRFLR